MLKSSLLSLALLLSATSCVVGAPPGFSDGDLWEVPLVAPLEDDLLLVPVSINDKGPFLFMIDPDSERSSIESSIQNSLDLWAGRSAVQAQNEEDHLVKIILADVKKMTIGDLSIRNMQVRVHPDGLYWSGGRRVHGILGRDVISDSLIYKFDRDRGKMYIATQGHLKASPDAPALGFTQSYSQHRRYLSSIKINHKHNLTMHMDLGARTSMIWPALSKKYKLPTIPVSADLIDEFGTKRKVSSGTMAGIVTAGKTETNAILMLPYDDRRLEPEDLDGVIGQNFFSKYNLTINWHKKKIWLEPRSRDLAASAKERLERWGDQLRDCEKPACVSARIPELAMQAPVTPAAPVEAAAPEAAAPEAAAPGAAAPETAAPEAATPEAATPASTAEAAAPESAPDTSTEPTAAPTGPLSLVFERSAPGTGFEYDVVVAAVDAEGKTLDLPIFLVHFRSGISSQVWNNLDPAYAEAADFVVIDMNPVGTRACEGSRCVFPLRAPR